MLHLRKDRLPIIRAKHVVYFVRKKPSLMKLIVDNLREEIKKTTKNHDYHILFMPCKSWLCEKIFEDENVSSIISSVSEYPVEILPIDDDVLSMQMIDSLKDLFVEKDYSCLLHVARAIIHIQLRFGIIRDIYGQGSCAKRVTELLSKLKNEMSLNDSHVVPQIHSLLILDRSVDFITPLMNQMTYEGLCDEIFGVNNGVMKIPVEKLNKNSTSQANTDAESQPSQPAKETKSFKLNSSDTIFVKIRDKTFYDVGPIIKENAKKLSAMMEERHSAKSIEDMKLFMKKLPILQASKNCIVNQTSVAELIKQEVESEDFVESVEIQQMFVNSIETDSISTYIEDCIAKQQPLTKVIRLIALQSQTNNGLKKKVLEHYSREILQTYGYSNFEFLRNLELAGLIKVRNTLLNKPYNMLKKQFRLTRVKTEPDNDLTYVFNGYAPLSARIVESFLKSRWITMSETLKVLPGSTFEYHQQIPPELRRHRSSITSVTSSRSNIAPTEEPRVILVFFIGGVTFAEISALRLLAQKRHREFLYVVHSFLLTQNTLLF